MKIIKNGFTLIELLAVIIILAVIVLIATPVVLNVINNARQSARKSSVAGYADTVRLALVEKEFETNTTPNIDETFLNSLAYQGDTVSCSEVLSSTKYGVVLHECSVGNDETKYCFAMGKVYNCADNNTTYNEIYENSKNPTYADNSGANRPQLLDKMIPVIYNTDTGKWKYADVYSQWYDYDSKWWANAVVLVASPSKTYIVGNDISMDDIAMMYAWIPRYTYTIFNGNNQGVAVQQININFESGTDSSGTVNCMDSVSGSTSAGSETCTDTTIGSVVNGTSTYTHPAFTFGDQELKGIWVGKFELSTTDSVCLTSPSTENCNNTNQTIIIKPNQDSLRFNYIENFAKNIQNISTIYNISNTDSHMIRNVEWGAVAYLANSAYGRCTAGVCEEVTVNNAALSVDPYSTYTGCAGDSVSTGKVSTCASTNTYETDKGVKASTTGNIYGIYDMSGGAHEFVMANMVDSTGLIYSINSGFESDLDTKYYDAYSYRSVAATTNAFAGKLGDATKEILKTTSSYTGAWNSDYQRFTYSGFPLIFRGGNAGDGSAAGIFYFSANNGSGYQGISSRAVLVGK